MEHAGNNEGGLETDFGGLLGTVGEARCEGVLRVLWAVVVHVWMDV